MRPAIRLAAVCLLWGLCSAQAAMPAGEPDEPRKKLTLRTRIWRATGSVDTRQTRMVNPALVTPVGQEVFYGSTEERKTDAIMPLFSAEVAPLPWLSFELQYAQSQSQNRAGERHWVDAPGAGTLTIGGGGVFVYPVDHTEDTRFGSDHTARISWLAANAYFRAVDAPLSVNEDVRQTLDFALGLERFQQKSKFNNLQRELSAGRFYVVAPIGPIAGYEATYNATWQGPHIGLRDVLTFPYGFSVETSLFWAPFMQFRGDGFDNLTAGLRAESPNIIDRARGRGIHPQIGGAWTYKWFSIEAGYQRLYFYTNTGRHRFYLNNDTVTDSELDFATGELGGAYASASLRF